MQQLPNIWKTDKQDRRFMAVALAAHALFLLMAVLFKRIYMGDSFEYIYEAFNIKDLGIAYSGNPVLPIDPALLTQRQPVYPLFLLSVYLFTVNNWVVIVLQCLLSVGNMYLLRRLLLHLGFDKKYDYWLLLLTLTYPAQMINACTVAPDILLQSFTALYAYAAIRFLQQPKQAYLIAMSAALIAGALVKPVLFPFVFIHLAWVPWAAYRQGIKVQRPVVIAMLPLCAALLYANINSSRTGKYHYSSNTAFNALFYPYKYLSASQGEDSAARFLHAERARVQHILPYAAHYDAEVATGVLFLQQHWRGYTLYHLRKSAYMLVDPGKAEIDLFTGALTYGKLYSHTDNGFWTTMKKDGWGGLVGYCRRSTSILWALVVLLFNIVRVIGCVLFLRLKQYSGTLRWWAVGYILYFVLVTGPIENTRYLLPVSLLIAAFSTMGWVQWWRGRSIRH